MIANNLINLNSRVISQHIHNMWQHNRTFVQSSLKEREKNGKSFSPENILYNKIEFYVYKDATYGKQKVLSLREREKKKETKMEWERMSKQAQKSEKHELQGLKDKTGEWEITHNCS